MILRTLKSAQLFRIVLTFLFLMVLCCWWEGAICGIMFTIWKLLFSMGVCPYLEIVFQADLSVRFAAVVILFVVCTAAEGKQICFYNKWTRS